MKQRMKLGYEGACTDHVTRYDELGMGYYAKVATELLEGVDLRDKEVLDVGCGTGVLSLFALEQGGSEGGLRRSFRIHAGPVPNKGNC